MLFIKKEVFFLKKLAFAAIMKFLSGMLLLALILFASAGSYAFRNAYLFLGLLGTLVFISGVYLYKNDPELLKERLNAREKDPAQRVYVLLSGLVIAAVLIVSGLSFRLKLIRLSLFTSIIAAFAFTFFYLLFFVIMRENQFLWRTVDVKPGQRVVTTGLYSVVRHPMYMVTVFLFALMPIVLGSAQGFYVSLFYPLVLVKRIKNEEAFLEKNHPGYIEYENKVRFRLLPFIY